MSILLISKSEMAIPNRVSGVKYHFVACMALCNVYYNFQNSKYILLYSLYVIGFFIYLKTDYA